MTPCNRYLALTVVGAMLLLGSCAGDSTSPPTVATLGDTALITTAEDKDTVSQETLDTLKKCRSDSDVSSRWPLRLIGFDGLQNIVATCTDAYERLENERKLNPEFKTGGRAIVSLLNWVIDVRKAETQLTLGEYGDPAFLITRAKDFFNDIDAFLETLGS